MLCPPTMTLCGRRGVPRGAQEEFSNAGGQGKERPPRQTFSCWASSSSICLLACTCIYSSKSLSRSTTICVLDVEVAIRTNRHQFHRISSNTHQHSDSTPFRDLLLCRAVSGRLRIVQRAPTSKDGGRQPQPGYIWRRGRRSHSFIRECSASGQTW